MSEETEFLAPRPASLRVVPRLWIYTQALIVIFVLAGIVIAIIRLS